MAVVQIADVPGVLTPSNAAAPKTTKGTSTTAAAASPPTVPVSFT